MRHYDPEAHVYRAKSGRLPGATDIIKAEGLIAVEWMSEEAMWRGKCVHRGIELMNRGELNWATLDESIAGYLYSYQRFLEATKFQIVGYEQACFSTAFACLPDLWGHLNGERTIIELKTGAVPAWAAFQTALQQRALLEDQDFHAVKRFGLRLMADGSISKLVAFPDASDIRRAMGLVDMFHWKVAHRIIRDWN